MTGPIKQPRPSGVRPSAGGASIPGQAGGRAPVRPPSARARTSLAEWADVIGHTTLPANTRMWQLFLPPGQELLNANHRPHWSKRNRITQQLRSDAYFLAKYAKVPALKRARVWCVYQPPRSRAVKDVGNLAPSAKACVDGALVDAGILIDDSDDYLVGPDMRRGSVHPQGRLVLLIAELEPLTQEPTP